MDLTKLIPPDLASWPVLTQHQALKLLASFAEQDLRVFFGPSGPNNMAPFGYALQLMGQDAAVACSAYDLCATAMQKTWIFNTSSVEPHVWLSELCQV